VVLDGRTGLVHVREKVTEDELSDPEFYVEREKLELPDDVDVDELTFQVGDSVPVDDGGDAYGDDYSDMGGGGESGSEQYDFGASGSGSGAEERSSGGTSDWDGKLDESNLTEEEKENVRGWMGGTRR
ncbi:MAG: hypothetical protein JXQ75_07445, partial [Phycisphaerae bacterium]|nr:hypothetical protein [Phycisphaerae bacterium]